MTINLNSNNIGVGSGTSSRVTQSIRWNRALVDNRIINSVRELATTNILEFSVSRIESFAQSHSTIIRHIEPIIA